MSEYLESSQIKVYPSAFRSSNIDLEASRFTEGSITKLVKAPLSKESFVKIETDGSMTLVLGGYIFTIVDPIINIKSLFNNQPENIYAFIAPKVITSTEDSIPLTMLVNIEDESSTLDDISKFKALAFSDTKPSEENYPLQIKVLELDSTSNEYVIPTSSKLILDSIQIKDNLSNDKSIRELFKTDELYDLGQKADSNEYWGLRITDEGKIEKNDLEHINEKPSGNNYSFIDSISVESDGSINTDRHTIPDASATQKGLVNTDSQTFSGQKYFTDGIEVDSIISDYQGGFSLTSRNNINISSVEGDMELNTSHGTVNYNSKEIATKYFMENSGVSARAKKLGDSNGLYSIGSENTPVYVSVGQVYPCYYSMVGSSKDSTGSPTKSRLLISDQNIGWDDTRGPYHDAFTYSDSDLIIDDAYLNGIAYNRSFGTSGKGAATLTLVIRKYPSTSEFQITTNKWLKIDLQQFLATWFPNYEFRPWSGIVQEESFSFNSKRGAYSTFSGQTYRINQDKFWVIPYGNLLYIGAVGDSSMYYQLTVTLYGNLLYIS